MTLVSDDLALTVSRCGVMRCGASRCGFVPEFTATDTGFDPGPLYAWEEFKQDADGTAWSVVRE